MNQNKYQLPQLTSLIRSYFFSGMLVGLPLGVIAWISVSVLETLWLLPGILPDAWQPRYWIQDSSAAELVNALIVLGLAVLLVLGVSLLGWVSTQYLGKKLLEMLAHLIQRIPVLRSIYSALDQLLRTFTSGSGQQFNRVVYIEYPRKGCWTLAFVTGEARAPQGLQEGQFLNVYVPTTPNPTSGFHLIIEESEVRESGMNVEEAFRTILSLGIAQPATGATGTSGGAHGSR
jgi:uncharacterized membrane protein